MKVTHFSHFPIPFLAFRRLPLEFFWCKLRLVSFLCFSIPSLNNRTDLGWAVIYSIMAEFLLGILQSSLLCAVRRNGKYNNQDLLHPLPEGRAE